MKTNTINNQINLTSSLEETISRISEAINKLEIAKIDLESYRDKISETKSVTEDLAIMILQNISSDLIKESNYTCNNCAIIDSQTYDSDNEELDLDFMYNNDEYVEPCNNEDCYY